ncbi:hypothetical protein [Polyangium jinanense]|uniref:Uncharacterized protein n=1 Tax=Polyangium jinanense TaxID=2829994 RepID=A0A9X3X5G8_9BACT|nr:hypothetical protein [Polyangium jinanense]MDC3956034.1 hypothetical protein [Polyangium jinanense]MDC3982935.1 hypothetical protein [Polyangium jinanense]
MATMDDLDKLPPDLAWQHDGHVTDIVLSSVADGEAGIVPADALSHLDGCDHCAQRLGAEALLSAHASELLAELAEPSFAPVKAPVKADAAAIAKAPASVRGLATLPKRAVLGALLLATLGALPGILDRIAGVPSLLGTIWRASLMLTRSAALVSKSEWFPTLAFAASAVLLISGLVVSRMSRPGSSNDLAQEGGV